MYTNLVKINTTCHVLKNLCLKNNAKLPTLGITEKLGCFIRQAVQNGRISQEHFESQPIKDLNTDVQHEPETDQRELPGSHFHPRCLFAYGHSCYNVPSGEYVQLCGACSVFISNSVHAVMLCLKTISHTRMKVSIWSDYYSIFCPDESVSISHFRLSSGSSNWSNTYFILHNRGDTLVLIQPQGGEYVVRSRDVQTH